MPTLKSMKALDDLVHRKAPKKPTSKQLRAEHRQQLTEAITEAVLFKNKLMELRLYRSGQLMGDVVAKMGWELAEVLNEE